MTLNVVAHQVPWLPDAAGRPGRDTGAQTPGRRGSRTACQWILVCRASDSESAGDSDSLALAESEQSPTRSQIPSHESRAELLRTAAREASVSASVCEIVMDHPAGRPDSLGRHGPG